MGIPAPDPGLVIHYAYLWHYEHSAGKEEGKDRPSVIVLCVDAGDENTSVVTVLPITHSVPNDPATAVNK